MNFLIVVGAKYLFVFVIVGIFIAWLRVDTEQKKRLAVATVLAGIIAFALSRVAGHLYFDPRPFVTQHAQPLVAHAPDNGFPSDHALLTMTVSAVVYFFNKRVASGMLVLTILVGLARIAALVHSPLDIVSGWFLGIVGAVLGYYLMCYWFNRHKDNLSDA